jgi:hypothetical protein
VHAIALAAIEMALAGIEFAIPADEVIDTMGEIGESMDVRYRETAGGGSPPRPPVVASRASGCTSSSAATDGVRLMPRRAAALLLRWSRASATAARARAACRASRRDARRYGGEPRDRRDVGARREHPTSGPLLDAQRQRQRRDAVRARFGGALARRMEGRRCRQRRLGGGGRRPCAADGAASCVYIGDVGDNNARRRTVSLWRVPEPDLDAGTTARAERVRMVYSDGPRDVEAMWVAPDTSVWFVSKRPHGGVRNVYRPALVYRLPPSAWTTRTSADAPAMATLVDSLPIVPVRESNGAWIVDAALRGSRLVIRTYQDVYVFTADSATGRPGGLLARCATSVTRQRLGESGGLARRRTTPARSRRSEQQPLERALP